jgi:hypothetical protein
VPRQGAVGTTLKELIASWTKPGVAPVLRREHLTNEAAARADGALETSLHLARLWANDEVRRLAAARQTEAAIRLATAFQLVTPVSGAVVLETQQQYAQNNLEPVDAMTVPSIPEPSTWLLLVVGLVVLLLAYRARQRIEGDRAV